MGILDGALETLGNKHLPLIDSRTRLLETALSLLASNGQTGGLHGLVERFQEAGLGNLIHSWIATGENAPITAQQIELALGEGQLQQIAEETGLTEHEAAERLCEMLPDLIDKLTPDGRIPQGGVGDTHSLLDHFMGNYY